MNKLGCLATVFSVAGLLLGIVLLGSFVYAMFQGGTP